VDFKLHLSRQTVIKGKVKDGALISWSVIPESRKDDVEVCKIQDDW
jgi:hypothetical protein